MQQACMKAALARSGLYRWLSLGFSYPSPAIRDEFDRVQALLKEQGVLKGLPEVQFEDPETLVPLYLTLFDRKATCSPYESEYGDGAKEFTKSRDLVDIAGFYQAFGFDLNEAVADLHDHIKVELEFMSILALKEAYAWSENLEDSLAVTMDAEKAFLEDHVGRWVPAFCRQLAEADPGFYGLLSRLTQEVVRRELAAWGAFPRQLHRRPGGTADDDCLICPMAR